mgnify:FL=1
METPVSLLASCRWKGSDKEEPVLRSEVIIHLQSVSKTVDELTSDIYQVERRKAEKEAREAPDRDMPPEDLVNLGDEAFLTIHPGLMTVQIKARSENAIVNTTLWLNYHHDLRRRIELLRAQRSNIIAATQDILDDLR